MKMDEDEEAGTFLPSAASLAAHISGVLFAFFSVL